MIFVIPRRPGAYISLHYKQAIMNTNAIASRLPRLLTPIPDSPSVVITLPFNPKMTTKGQLDAALKDAAGKAARQLMSRYPRQAALPVIHLLQKMLCELNYSTHKKSIVLLVSPETEKVMYLDEPLDTRVLVDTDFRIRDLTTTAEAGVQYLVLLLSGCVSRMYHCDGGRLKLIKNNALKTVDAYLNEVPEKTASFSDPAARKQVMLDKFLLDMDEGLSTILDAYPLPVFVIATDKILGHFAGITRNDCHIAVYIPKHWIGSKEMDILETLQPYLRDWHPIRLQMALKYIDIARETGKLVTGIEEIGKAVRTRNNRLLIVERGFTDSPGSAVPGEFYIHDRVDAIVKKVLEDGGQVEWLEPGQLERLGHIVLIRYY
jgi:hypothetical protein